MKSQNLGFFRKPDSLSYNVSFVHKGRNIEIDLLTVFLTVQHGNFSNNILSQNILQVYSIENKVMINNSNMFETMT